MLHTNKQVSKKKGPEQPTGNQENNLFTMDTIKSTHKHWTIMVNGFVYQPTDTSDCWDSVVTRWTISRGDLGEILHHEFWLLNTYFPSNFDKHFSS